MAPLTQADLHELYTIIGALEGAAARLLSTLAADARRMLATRLARAHETFEAIARRPPLDFELMFQSHNTFHAVLVDGLATARLLALIEQVRPHIHRYEYMYAGLVGPDYRQTFREHRAIVHAVRSVRSRRPSARSAPTGSTAPDASPPL